MNRIQNYNALFFGFFVTIIPFVSGASAPMILSVDPHGNPNGVTVVYSQPVGGATSTNVANYNLTNSLGVTIPITNAMLASDKVTVQLQLGASLQINTNYTLTVGNVYGTNGAILNPNPMASSFTYGWGATFAFDDGQLPAGTILRGGPDSAGNQTNPGLGVTNAGGYNNSGCLILTVPASGQTFGQWLITNNLANGQTVTNLNLSFKLFVGDGNNYWAGLPNSGGNGMLFHWGPGMLDQYTGGASSWGGGLDVTFRTVNSGGNQGYGINIFYGGTAGPGNNTPIETSSYIGYFNTNGAADNFSEAANVNLIVSNGMLSVQVTTTNGVYTNVYSNFAIPGFVPPPMGGTNVGFTATDGSGAHEDCWLDNVDFTINGQHIPGRIAVGPVVFILQPTNQTVNGNVTTTFAASVTGAPPFSFQWMSNSVPIPGANAMSYTTPPASSAMNGAVYSVVVSNAFSSAVSSNAILTVLQAPVSIIGQPQSQTVPANWPATFTVSVAPSSTGPLAYQWWQIVGTSTNLIVGATNATYTTPPLTMADNGMQFFAVVTGPLNTEVSSTAILTVAQYPVAIISQPQNQTVPANSTATIAALIDPSSTGPVVCQWWQVLAGVSANLIAGATNSSYTTPVLAASNSGAQFYLVVSNEINSVTSSIVTVTVLPPAQLFGTALLNSGTNLTLNCSNWTGGGVLFSATNLTGPWSPILGATNTPFTIPLSPNTPQQFFKVQQFGASLPSQDYTPYVNMVQDDNGGHGLYTTALMRYPLGRIGLWSVAPGEFADCVTRSLRLYPCIDTIVNKGTTDWRNTISGNPSVVSITYQTNVAAKGSLVDLTVTPHVSIYRYHLAAGTNFQAIAMMVNDLGIDTSNWVNNSFTVIDSQTVQATLSGNGRTVYFYIKFSVPSVGYGTINNTTVTDGAGSISGNPIGGYLKFGTSNVIAAVAISHTSMAQAQTCFNGEFGDMDFNTAATNLKNAWIEKLGKVEAQGPTLAMQQLYTALYTVYVNTIDASDNPYYTSYKPLLTIASSDYWQAVGSYLRCDWDMSRGVYQLVALIDPDEFTSILNTYQAQYNRDQRMWCNWDPFSASGFSVTMFLPDFGLMAGLQGITGVDYNELKNSLTNNYQHYYPSNFFDLHYIPSNDPQDQGNNPASHTMDYSVPMRSLANWSGLLGDMASYTRYYPYRLDYTNLYYAANPQFCTKLANGSWGTLGADFFEGDGVDYGFAAPQDPYGVLGLYGPSNAVSRIDNYLISQADYNDYQLIYMWLPIFADRADVTESLVRTGYIPRFDALSMAENFYGSGWTGDYYTDNAGPLACCLLGLYYIPTSGAEWMMTAPSFNRIVIHGRTDLTIQTVNNSTNNNYISSIQLNGVAYPSFVISGETLVASNQTITITLTNQPTKIGNLYLSSADGDVLSAGTDNSTYLDFVIDPLGNPCFAQVYSSVQPSSITLNGASFSTWTYNSTNQLATLTGVTKGAYRVVIGN